MIPDLILIRRENADMRVLLPRSISYFRFLSNLLPEQMVWKTNFGSALIVVLLLEYGHYFDEFWPEREIKVCQNTTITTFWQIIIEIDTTKQEGRSFWHVLCEKNRNSSLNFWFFEMNRKSSRWWDRLLWEFSWDDPMKLRTFLLQKRMLSTSNEFIGAQNLLVAS